MVLVDVQVAGRIDLGIEGAMAGQQLEHMVEKPYPRVDAVSALAFEAELDRNLRLFGSPIDQRAAHNTSSITAMQRLVCSTMPVAMRIRPAQPGSVERFRM